jgi:hypothetical protein
METVHLDDIVRQRDPALKAVVEQLARGDVHAAVDSLQHQGRVHAVADRPQRFAAIAEAYAQAPDGTLVVSPDNQSRAEINQAIHRRLQATGRVQGQEHHVRVLVPRHDVTGADRQWAAQYESGDVVRYARGSRALGLAAGEYVRVVRHSAPDNRVTVARATGEHLTYDPRRLQGVALYREAARALAVGDRVQFTAPDAARHVANRELGTLDAVDTRGRLHVRLDSGRAVAITVQDPPHLDHGYAVTSHSSQGQTADRVLVHVDTTQGPARLVNRRLAYVAVSRGRFDAHIYTDDTARLGHALSRDAGKPSALDPSQAPTGPGHTVEPPAGGRRAEPRGLGR